MCWAIPARITEVDGAGGKVEISGTIREIGLQLVDEPKVGDYVLVHAGFAIEKVSEDEAQETLRLWEEILQATEGSR